jgi:predicted enzyme related to lactoylglutathione lyase
MRHWGGAVTDRPDHTHDPIMETEDPTMDDEPTPQGGIGAVGWMRSIVIDAHDPDRLAEFWCRMLDVEVVERESDWVQLSPDPGGAFLAFQPTTAARPATLVARPDVEVTDIEVARRRVEDLGGSYVRTIEELKGDSHYVMADPEGNEFCLVQPLPPELARPRWGDRTV